jgi:hypothetical protein
MEDNVSANPNSKFICKHLMFSQGSGSRNVFKILKSMGVG